jgi:hypothetical protein
MCPTTGKLIAIFGFIRAFLGFFEQKMPKE